MKKLLTLIIPASILFGSCGKNGETELQKTARIIKEHEREGATFLEYVNSKGETDFVVGADKNGNLQIEKPKDCKEKDTK